MIRIIISNHRISSRGIFSLQETWITSFEFDIAKLVLMPTFKSQFEFLCHNFLVHYFYVLGLVIPNLFRYAVECLLGLHRCHDYYGHVKELKYWLAELRKLPTLSLALFTEKELFICLVISVDYHKWEEANLVEKYDEIDVRPVREHSLQNLRIRDVLLDLEFTRKFWILALLWVLIVLSLVVAIALKALLLFVNQACDELVLYAIDLVSFVLVDKVIFAE